MFGFTPYNYETFRRNLLIKDMVVTKFLGAPKPGQKAPDFEGRTIDGDQVRLSDYRGESNVVLTFGSATCPFTAASLRGLNDLYEDFADEVEFLFVYVREAHPGEELGPHSDMREKLQAAEMLRDEEDVQMPIIVDDLNGRIQKNRVSDVEYKRCCTGRSHRGIAGAAGRTRHGSRHRARRGVPGNSESERTPAHPSCAQTRRKEVDRRLQE